MSFASTGFPQEQHNPSRAKPRAKAGALSQLGEGGTCCLVDYLNIKWVCFKDILRMSNAVKNIRRFW